MIGTAVSPRMAGYMVKAISLCLEKGAESIVAEPSVEYDDSYCLVEGVWI